MTIQNVLRGAIYCRVSTEDQETNGKSLPYQKDACLKFALENNLIVSEEKIFMEQYSGGFLDRPQLTRVFDLAQKKQIDFVIFTKRDRVARDQWVFQSIMKQLNDASVKVFYSEEKLTGDIAMDNFMGSTIVGFAAWEREQIKLRTNAGKRQHVRENKWPFSSIPYGYKKNTKKELELYQPEAEIAKSIIESYLNDKKSIYRIFEDLNNAHIPPPTYSTKQDSKQEGNKKLRKNATPYWCFSSVRRILRNAVVYSGSYQAFKTCYRKEGNRTVTVGERPKEEWIEMKLPSFISVTQAEDINKKLEDNRQFSKKRSVRTYLLQGKLYCDCEVCLHNFIGYYNNKKELRNYRCSLYNSTKADDIRRCGNHISGHKIESVVIDTLREIFTDPFKIFLDFQEKKENDKDRFYELEGEILKLSDKVKRNEELYVEGHISKERFLKIKKDIDQVVNKLKDEQAKEWKIVHEESTRESFSKNWEKQAEKLRELAEDFFDNATYEELKDLVDIIVDQIIVPVDKSEAVKIRLKMTMGDFEMRYLNDNLMDFQELNLNETKKPLLKRKVEFLDSVNDSRSTEHVLIRLLKNKYSQNSAVAADHLGFNFGDIQRKG